MLVDDLRHGLRAVARKPGFTAAVVLLLGLGVGATAAVFSVVDACLLRPLPFAGADRIVSIFEEFPKSRGRWSLDPFHVFLLEGEARSFDLLASYVAADKVGFDLAGEDRPERVEGAAVSPDFFTILGARPILGRTFTKEDDASGEPVVILGHGLFQRRFGGDRHILGRSILLSGLQRTVVGVMPPGFDFPGVEVWLPGPLFLDRALGLPVTTTFGQKLLGRLKDGVTMEEARAELTRLSGGLKDDVAWNGKKGIVFRLEPLQEALLGDLRQILWVLFGSTGLLLLITCTNLSNLVLGRLLTRQPELTMRSVLGASTKRLAGQLLFECLFLGAAGGLVGAGLGSLALRSLLPLLAPLLPVGVTVRMDLRMLGLLITVAAVCGVLSGLVPVFRLAGRQRLSAAGPASAGLPGRQLWGLLVIAQIALSFALLSGEGLMIRSFRALSSRQLGFEPRNVLTFSVTMSKYLYPSAADRRQFVHRALDRLSRTPGVLSVAASDGLPFAGGSSQFLVTREEQQSEDLTRIPMADCWSITPSFFRTLGIKLTKGRRFNDLDHATAQPVVIVDEAVAIHLWPGEEPLGKRVSIDGVWREVVGVAALVANRGPREDPAGLTYVPLEQARQPSSSYSFTLKAAGDPRLAAAAALAALREVTPNQAVYGLTTMAERLKESSSRERLVSLVLGLFAFLGTVLASSGLFAVVRFATVQRRREIGIRMALGAGKPTILRLVLLQGGRLVALGLVVGFGVALLSSRALTSLLYGVSPADSATCLGVTLVLLAVAVPAVALPGLEALRSDPLQAIRSDCAPPFSLHPGPRRAQGAAGQRHRATR